MRKITTVVLALAVMLGAMSMGAIENSVEEFEKQTKGEIKDWEGKISHLREEMKKTSTLEKHHRHLKRAARHLESDIRSVQKELSQLKVAKEKDRKHHEDHIRAELEDMTATYDKVLTE